MTITLHQPGGSKEAAAGNSSNSSPDLREVLQPAMHNGGGRSDANRPVFVSGQQPQDPSWVDINARANSVAAGSNMTTAVLEGPYYNYNPTMDPNNNDTLSVSMSTGGQNAGGTHDVCDAFSFPYVDLTQSDIVRQAFVIIYVIVIVLSLFGNWMVIWTVIRNKHMRTVTNYYIVNLAVSDFLVAVFVMPLKLLEYTAPCAWHIFSGDAMCSFMAFVLPVFVFASVLTLVAISMERYYAIVYPLSAMKVHSKSRTRKILACTWIIPIIVASPYLFYKSYPFVIFSDLGSISRQICTDRFDEIDVALYGDEGRNSGHFRKGFFFFLFIAIYLVPLLVILGTCVRIAIRLLKPVVEKQESVQGQRITRKREENKRRVARMIVVVAVAFILAWSPFYLVSFISQVQTTSFLRKSNYIFVMLAVHLVGFINSCINPFIYNFMSDKFRKSFAQIMISMCCLCTRLPCMRKHLAKRARAAFARSGSEYDPDYSMADFSRAQTQNSPLDTEPANGSRGLAGGGHHGGGASGVGASGRFRYDSGSTEPPGTPPAIIRLTALNGSHADRNGSGTSATSGDLPNGTAFCSNQNSSSSRVRVSSSSTSPASSVSKSMANSKQLDGSYSHRISVTHLDKTEDAGQSRALSEMSQQHEPDLEGDFYDQPTSNLLSHSQGKGV